MRGIVPAEIIERKDKMGLAVPHNIWFKNELKDWVKELKLNLTKRGIVLPTDLKRGEFDRLDYTCAGLEIWHKLFFDKQSEYLVNYKEQAVDLNSSVLSFGRAFSDAGGRSK